MDEDEELKNYLQTKIHPIFEKIVIDLMVERPENVVKHL